jgi:hypothetical protein
MLVVYMFRYTAPREDLLGHGDDELLYILHGVHPLTIKARATPVPNVLYNNLPILSHLYINLSISLLVGHQRERKFYYKNFCR